MQLFKRETSIDFMSGRKLALTLSAVLLLTGLVALGVRGLQFGIDFTGGTLVEVGYPQAAELGVIRRALAAAGFEDAVVQHFGSTREVLVRLRPSEAVSEAELSEQIHAVLEGASGGGTEMRRIEFVGPQVGEELTNQGGIAMLIALGGIFIYVLLRFEWRFSLGSVAALFHDVLAVIGFFAVLGLDFDLTVLAAILAVIGYSLNDTIVVYDRIRENFRRVRKGSPVEVVNRSLNQTLSRTLMTSMTTLLVLGALFLVGGELIHGFATALIVGVIVGTYSSIYIASATVLGLGVSKADLMPVEKEGADPTDRP